MSVRPALLTALCFAFAGCSPQASAEDASVIILPEDAGTVDAGTDAGFMFPHPAGCGDRRGPGVRHRDTIASCPLPTGADLLADAGTLPPGEPVLVLGDDVLLIVPGASTASLFDLHRGRQKVQLALAGPFVPKTAIANTIRICLLVTLGGTQLQCFDRNLGTSLFTLPISGVALTLEDAQLQSSTLWLSYSVAGFGELLAIDLLTPQVIWRRPRLDGTGHLVRVGSQLVGYDEQPCAELANPDACLRAIDALTGEVRATQAARYFHFVWQHGTRALFSDDTGYFEYDAATSTFRDATADLAPLLAGLGATRLYPEGEALPDGRVLINDTKHARPKHESHCPSGIARDGTFCEMSFCTSLVLVLLTSTPAQLTALRQHRDAEEKKADLLTRDGKYGEAIKVLEALQVELQTKLKDVPQKQQEGASLATSLSVLKSDLEELTSWAELATKAKTSAAAAMRLLLARLHPKQMNFDGYRVTVNDPQVQQLISTIRKLDAGAAKVLGPRKVKVVVSGKNVEEAARVQFAAQLVSTLKALGHDAAVGTGTESFEVELVMKGPVSAHLIGDDVDECALVAVAKWEAGGLKRVDLTSHGFGDEETDGDCFNDRVRDAVGLAAEQILRTAMRLPLAVNLNKAEGPNGVFE